MRLPILVAAGLLGGLLLPMSPAAASCAGDAGPDGAPVIFVGTAEADRRGYTRFEVDEVWAGPDLAPEVWVLSGQKQAPWPLSLVTGVSSSVDAQFDHGEQYVVGASRSFATNACSFDSADGVASPADAREPVEHGLTGADPPVGVLGLSLWAAALLGAGALAGGLLRRLRRRTPHAERQG